MFFERVLLFAMSVTGSFHLTSIWLCMSVVFVVLVVQWPIGTNMTSPFRLLISLQQEFQKHTLYI